MNQHAGPSKLVGLFIFKEKMAGKSRGNSITVSQFQNK